MKIRSLHDRAVIRRAEGDVKSKGGIIIRDAAKEKQGEVAAVGPGLRDKGGSGTEVTIDDETLLIVKETGIAGIVEKIGGASQKAA